MDDQRSKNRVRTRTRVLEIAAQLFQRQGYAATSINQIILESGHTKGSIYFHFPGGKKEIATAAAAYSSQIVIALIEEILNSSSTALKAFSLVCAAFSNQLKASEYRDGCPISPLAISAAGESSFLRESCARAYAEWVSTIEISLRNYGFTEAKCASLATLLLSSVEGAILLSQARRNTGALDLLPVSLAPLLDPACKR